KPQQGGQEGDIDLALLRRQVSSPQRLDLALCGLLHRQRVEDADHPFCARVLQGLGDLPLEVLVVQAHHHEMDRTNRLHAIILWHLAHPFLSACPVTVMTSRSHRMIQLQVPHSHLSGRGWPSCPRRRWRRGSPDHSALAPPRPHRYRPGGTTSWRSRRPYPSLTRWCIRGPGHFPEYPYPVHHRPSPPTGRGAG